MLQRCRSVSVSFQSLTRFWNFSAPLQIRFLQNACSKGIPSTQEDMHGNRDPPLGSGRDSGTSTIKKESGVKQKRWEPWAEALRKMALLPEEHGDTLLQVTQEAIVLPDKFPKGRKHLLVVSRQEGLDSLEDLDSSHLQLLRNLQKVGEAWTHSILSEDPSLVFRLGFHSEPSMRQLHMHVISQDFDSPSLKNKKHWNSFTTSFFRDSKAVIDELEATGKVKPYGDESSLQRLEMRCHRCLYAQPNIPRLKQHIQSCKAPFPLDLVQKGYLYTAK